ncbi:MAG: type VI secretion system contractile sheath small subunit [Saprospiraceae bacterium]|nr:type VI secretion system contractile sheath small subunit [Saprospiraceae bacterium]
MSLRRKNVGAQGQDGIDAQVGITFLDPDRTMMILPLQQDPPSDPEEMIIEGSATYSINNMFKSLKPSVELSLETGDAKNPFEEANIQFTSIKSFEPDEIMKSNATLRSIEEKRDLINRIEQLMHQESFQNMMKDPEKKQSLIDFLRSVINDIEATEAE